ncbi:MAG: cobyric acid synthase CobQ, partial [Eubacteriales bacterium]
MMGRTVSDPDNTEGGGSLRGMSLLPIDTVFRPSKTTTQTRGTLLEIDGVLSDLSGLAVEGYEIHMGETVRDASAKPLVRLLRREGEIEDGCQTENAFGTYLHGVFDAPKAALRTAQALAKKKGVTLTGEALDTHAYKEQQYDKLADSVRKSLDMEWIYRIMEGKA